MQTISKIPIGKISAIGLTLALSGPVMADTLGTIDAIISFPNATRTHNIDTNIGPSSYAGLASGSESDPNWNFLSNPDGSFHAWCLEPTEFLDGNNTYNVNTLESAPQDGNNFEMGDISGFAGTTRADDMRLLVGGVFDFATGIFSDLDMSLNGGMGLSGKDLYTAFQVAVWEIANEDTAASYDVTSGGFQRDSGGGSNWSEVASQANQWLASLGSYSPNTYLLALVDGNNQDFLVSAVPIPGAVWLFGSVLLGWAGIGRRRGSDA
jgi:hypothetical protein